MGEAILMQQIIVHTVSVLFEEFEIFPFEIGIWVEKVFPICWLDGIDELCKGGVDTWKGQRTARLSLEFLKGAKNLDVQPCVANEGHAPSKIVLGLMVYIGLYHPTQLNEDYNKPLCPDPYETTSIMESKAVFFFRGSTAMMAV